MQTASWNPPEEPDPDAILREGYADASAKRYEEALTKYVWFHKNALKYEKPPGSLGGIRLCDALWIWKELGDNYPPALEKLKELRDDAGKAIREKRGDWQLFADHQWINEVLKEEDKSADLFVWLDANDGALAARTFDIAERALIKSAKFELCAKYLHPDRDYAQATRMYHMGLQISLDPDREPEERRELQGFAEKSFSNRTATLVALLVRASRKPEAEQVVDKAKKEWDDPGFHRALDAAFCGEVPEPWS